MEVIHSSKNHWGAGHIKKRQQLVNMLCSYRHFFKMIANKACATYLHKCFSCLVEHRGSQRALNVSMCQLHSPFICNVYFFVCTGNTAIPVSNLLDQLTRVLVHRDKPHVLKIQLDYLQSLMHWFVWSAYAEPGLVS